MTLIIAAFYHFAPLPDADGLRAPLRAAAEAGGVKGSILVAPEGINGTIVGPRDGIDAVLAHLRAWPGFAGLEHKESPADEMPFRRLKIRLKREIVTLGQPADPRTEVGTYVAPDEWNAVIRDPDTVVIDTRNDYEIAIGSFEGALDPKTDSFGQFPDWWAENRDQLEGKRIAMFCTGGIRCEKASSWLLQQGVPEVLHLKGGILKYLEDVPEAESAWRGECYVFDKRVAVGHRLAQGTHTECNACGRPVSPDGRRHPAYIEGVQCAACVHEYSDADRERFAERHRQMARSGAVPPSRR
ncbi:MAG: rhodanese-related sulfurtransferase [Pseudomonadota bacterium]